VDAREARNRDQSVSPPRPHLRRWLMLWAWLILAGMVVGGVGGVISGIKATPLYVAQAVVVATATPISSTNFGDVAQAAFATDAVLQPVIDRFGLGDTARSLISSGRLTTQPITGSAAIKIIARDKDAQLAANLANDAAASFINVAKANGLGTFAQFETRVPARTRVPRPTRERTLLGAIGGGAIAFLIALLVLVVRRPVLSEDEAREELPSAASFTARVGSVSRFGLRAHGKALDNGVHPRGLGRAVWREAGMDGALSPEPVCCVLVPRGRSDHALRTVFEEIKGNRPRGTRQRPSRLRCLRADDEQLLPALLGASSVVTLIADRVPSRSLRRLDEEFRVVLGDKPRVLVYVVSAGTGPGMRGIGSRRPLVRTSLKQRRSPPS
jgi:capsular polysaccharide biosynthesis protein